MTPGDHAKAHGVHYTPADLAAFLAEVTVKGLRPMAGPIAVLDPACGDGGLLLAIARAVPAPARTCLELVGYEQDAGALHRASTNLARIGAGVVRLHSADFLAIDGEEPPRIDLPLSLSHPSTESGFPPRLFDVVIANPPYVRTQILGAEQARDLARRFGLTGRVDLYHAFMMAVSAVLRPGGVLGLLASNRFLFIQSGAAVRHLLRTQFDVQAVYDLGDTRLFSAAVLPAIVVARKGPAEPDSTCLFERVYESRSPIREGTVPPDYRSVLDALRGRVAGTVQTPAGWYTIERGELPPSADPTATWSLSTPGIRAWIATVEAHRAHTFEDVARIRVGIKTTADRVFIRDDWDQLPEVRRPEPDLLRPILTHHDITRWRIRPGLSKTKQVLYPHHVRQGRREPVDLDAYPRARSYLESERRVLEGRAYVIAAGRRWYEIWVPQDPGDWALPRIVCPDIAEHPRFVLDLSGAVVNGDCYWATLRPGTDPDWLPLMLAVANSSFITKYYDTVFHNKLYAGRRRFMAQYVKQFPLPDLGSPVARRLVEEVNPLLGQDREDEDREARVDALVWEAFGLTAESSRDTGRLTTPMPPGPTRGVGLA